MRGGQGSLGGTWKQFPIPFAGSRQPVDRAFFLESWNSPMPKVLTSASLKQEVFQ
jgi:hypothetical protein